MRGIRADGVPTAGHGATLIALVKRRLGAALFPVVSVEFSGVVTQAAEGLAESPAAGDVAGERSVVVSVGARAGGDGGRARAAGRDDTPDERADGRGRRWGGCADRRGGRIRAGRVERALPVRCGGRLGAGISVLRGVCAWSARSPAATEINQRAASMPPVRCPSDFRPLTADFRPWASGWLAGMVDHTGGIGWSARRAGDLTRVVDLSTGSSAFGQTNGFLCRIARVVRACRPV